MARIFAAADIGSNTAHLLVAATDGDIVMRIDNVNEWIALGEVVARQGTIPKEQADSLIAAMREFRRVALVNGAAGIYVFATEAVRAAKNHKEVLKKIKQETGVTVDVISPDREAELSYYGVTLDTREVKPNLLFEVGGGSAQIGVIEGGKLKRDISLPLGTGRIIAEAGITNPCPPDVLGGAESYIAGVLSTCELDVTAPVAVASGGVVRGLWRALHPDGEKRLSMEEIRYLSWSAQRLPLDRLVARFNVKVKRAGTLLPGALVYEALLRKFGIQEFAISEFGVREGAILEMARGNIKFANV